MTRPQTVRSVLLAAARRVAMGWTQRAGARNAAGRKVSDQNVHAVRWCLVGAIWREGGNIFTTREAISTCEAHLGRGAVAWNDAPERTQSQVVAALRAAARKA